MGNDRETHDSRGDQSYRVSDMEWAIHCLSGRKSFADAKKALRVELADSQRAYVSAAMSYRESYNKELKETLEALETIESEIQSVAEALEKTGEGADTGSEQAERLAKLKEYREALLRFEPKGNKERYGEARRKYREFCAKQKRAESLQEQLQKRIDEKIQSLESMREWTERPYRPYRDFDKEIEIEAVADLWENRKAIRQIREEQQKKKEAADILAAARAEAVGISGAAENMTREEPAETED